MEATLWQEGGTERDPYRVEKQEWQLGCTNAHIRVHIRIPVPNSPMKWTQPSIKPRPSCSPINKTHQKRAWSTLVNILGHKNISRKNSFNILGYLYVPGMVLGAQNTALNRSQKPCSFLIKLTVLMGKGRQQIRYGNRNILIEYASDKCLKWERNGNI